MRCPTKTPCPEPEGKVRRSGQPPVEAIAVVAERPSDPATRHDAMADAEAPHAPAARHDGPKHPGHLMGMAAAHHAASTQAPRRPAKLTAASQCTAPPPGAPAHRYTAPRSNPIAAFPRAASAHAHPVPPWERRLAHGRSRARAAKTFPTGTGHPLENSGASAFRFTPCAAAFPQAPSAPQGAPRGRAPTREGRQPWERASTRGRTRQSART